MTAAPSICSRLAAATTQQTAFCPCSCVGDEMLDLARRSAPVVAERIGWDNCTFHKGYIQDLRFLNIEAVDCSLGMGRDGQTLMPDNK